MVSAIVPVEPKGIRTPIVPSSQVIDSSWRLAQFAAKSSMTKIKSDFDAFFIIMYGYELGVAPITALRMIFVVNGTPSCSGALLLALIRQSGLVRVMLPDIEEVKNSKRASVTMKRLDSGDEYTSVFTWDDAVKAGLTSKDTWVKFWYWMLLWRCVSNCANFLCSDITSGLRTVEEMAPDTPMDEDGNPTGDIVVEPPSKAVSQSKKPDDNIKDGEISEEGEPSIPSNITPLPPQDTKKKKPAWVIDKHIDTIFEYLHGQSLTDSDIFRLMKIAPDQKYGEWWWQYETGKAAKEAIMKAQEAEMSSLPPSQPKGTPPPQKENVWTDFDTHTLDEMVRDYGLFETEPTLKLLNVEKWQDFSTPAVARAKLKQLVTEMQPQLAIKKVTYHKQFTDLHCGDISVRAYGRDHFRSIEGSIIAQECENWEEGKSYTITEPEILYIQAKKWSYKGNNLDGYYIVENGGVKVDIPF